MNLPPTFSTFKPLPAADVGVYGSSQPPSPSPRTSPSPQQEADTSVNNPVYEAAAGSVHNPVYGFDGTIPRTPNFVPQQPARRSMRMMKQVSMDNPLYEHRIDLTVSPPPYTPPAPPCDHSKHEYEIDMSAQGQRFNYAAQYENVPQTDSEYLDMKGTTEDIVPEYDSSFDEDDEEGVLLLFFCSATKSV